MVQKTVSGLKIASQLKPFLSGTIYIVPTQSSKKLRFEVQKSLKSSRCSGSGGGANCSCVVQ